jgi:hypothetical protein
MTILHSVLYCLCSPRQMPYIFIIAMRIAMRRRTKPFLFLCMWKVFMVYMVLARKRFSVVKQRKPNMGGNP